MKTVIKKTTNSLRKNQAKEKERSSKQGELFKSHKAETGQGAEC